MSEIERLIKEKIEDYDEAYHAAQIFVEENQEEMLENFRYGEYLSRPVEKNQILFWCNGKGEDAQIPRYIFDSIHRAYKKEYRYVWVMKAKQTSLEDMPKDVVGIRKNSPEYWEALSCSGYLIGNGSLPSVFTKREEQVYFNSMSKLFEQKQAGAAMEEKELPIRQLLKTDFLFAKNPDEAKQVYGKEYMLENLYAGQVLLSENPGEDAASMANAILGKGSAKHIRLNENRKKTILLFTRWKEKREHRNLIRYFLSQVDKEKYDVTLVTPRIGNIRLEEEFRRLLEDVRRFTYHGFMNAAREELLHYKTLEKGADVYAVCPEIKAYMDGIVKREWQRIWGNVAFDCVVLTGTMGYPQYYMAGQVKAGKKVLLDYDFMELFREKRGEQWRTAMTMFDRIYAPAGKRLPGEYGEENRERVVSMPVSVENGSYEEAEIFVRDGAEYFVCDKWVNEKGRRCMKLVRLPKKGSCLVSAEVDADLLEALQKRAAGGQEVFLLGENAEEWKAVLPQAIVADEYVRKYLYMLPIGKLFFERFSHYYGESKDEDVTGIFEGYGIALD